MKLIHSILFLAVVLFSMVACDQIPESERLIAVSQVPFERTVILEDYTGQKCVNCPAAHLEIGTLTQYYGANLIPVSIHAGGFALPTLQTQAGNEYANFFKVDAYPTGIINRTKSATGDFSLLSDVARWQGAIRQLIWRQPEYLLQIESSFNDTDSTAIISVKLTAVYGDPAKHLSLQVWLTENNITALQYMPDGSRDRNYVHQHVLREAVNGMWGDEISFGTSAQSVLKSYTLSWMSKSWKVDHCEVVAFVYDTRNYEILNAAKSSLKNN